MPVIRSRGRNRGRNAEPSSAWVHLIGGPCHESLSLPGECLWERKMEPGASSEQRRLRACPQTLACVLDRGHRLSLPGAAPSVLSCCQQARPWGLFGQDMKGGVGNDASGKKLQEPAPGLPSLCSCLCRHDLTEAAPQPGTWSKTGGAERQLTGMILRFV